MAELVNLRQARKAKRRREAAATATVNRAAFGQRKGAKLAVEAEQERRRRTLDGAKRDE